MDTILNSIIDIFVKDIVKFVTKHPEMVDMEYFKEHHYEDFVKFTYLVHYFSQELQDYIQYALENALFNIKETY